MNIAMIAAMANNRIIGKDNAMPWHLPADLRHFKNITMGKPVIMGRNTYESIGRALPGRTNLVVSQKPDFTPPDATVVGNPQEALNLATTLPAEHNEIMIIGGGKIYESFLPLASKLYLTFIDIDVEGDTYFPDYTTKGNWAETSRETHHSEDSDEIIYHFVTLERKETVK